MKRVLLISVQGIGNTVLMTPVITALAGQGYEVDAVVSDNGSHEALDLCLDLRRRFVWRERQSVAGNLWRLRDELRHEQYDWACALYPNGKRENTLLCLARATRKSRYAHQQNRVRLLDFLPATDKLARQAEHDLTNNFRLIQSVEPRATHEAPRLSVSAEATAAAREFLTRNNLTTGFVVAIHPGGGGISKRWSMSNYRELCRRLAKDDSISFLIFGSDNEQALVREIVSGLGDRALPVCGESLRTVAALLSTCRLLVANDSSLSHIASALQVPVVAVWGYTDFRRVSPVNDHGVLVRIDYPCNPCYQFAKGYIDDCQYHLKCIKDISVDQVERIVVRYISSLKTQGSFCPESVADNANISFHQRIESGCVRIDLKAA